jgi:hypothetical protein
MSLTKGKPTTVDIALNPASEEKLMANKAIKPGKHRNRSAPLIRCRIDTLPAMGKRYAIKSVIPILRN